MTPREIDAKIAEAVMGLRLFVVDTAFGEGHAWLPAGSDPAQCCTFGEGFPRDVDLPRYSTDPAASKALREKLAEKWPTLNLIRKDGKFQFCYYLELEWFVGTWADTEEMAVCLCALKAYGVEV